MFCRSGSTAMCRKGLGKSCQGGIVSTQPLCGPGKKAWMFPGAQEGFDEELYPRWYQDPSYSFSYISESISKTIDKKRCPFHCKIVVSISFSIIAKVFFSQGVLGSLRPPRPYLNGI